MFRVNCSKWTDIGNPSCGECALGLFGGRPSPGVCGRCNNREAINPDAAAVEGIPPVAPSLGSVPPWYAGMWGELHTRRLTDPFNEAAWFYAWSARVIGCGGCAEHWASYISQRPPDLSSPERYHQWGIDAHNAVNVKLGRPKWTKPEVENAYIAPAFQVGWRERLAGEFEEASRFGLIPLPPTILVRDALPSYEVDWLREFALEHGAEVSVQRTENE